MWRSSTLGKKLQVSNNANIQEQSDLKKWPSGPYTQQIEGVLPPVLTEDLIISHLELSGKQLKKSKGYCNVDYSTLQQGHQYFRESYIPGRQVRFCV